MTHSIISLGKARSPCMASCPLPAAFSGSPLRVIAGYPMQTVFAVFKVRCWIWQ